MSSVLSTLFFHEMNSKLYLLSFSSGPDESPVGVSSRQVKSRESSQVREKADIKAKLEEARQRRLMIENSRLMFVYFLIVLFIIKLSFFRILRQNVYLLGSAKILKMQPLLRTYCWWNEM